MYGYGLNELRELYGNKDFWLKVGWVAFEVIFYFSAFVFMIHAMSWVHKKNTSSKTPEGKRNGYRHLFFFSIEDGKAVKRYSGDRIMDVKMTYYGHGMKKDGEIVKKEPRGFWFKFFLWPYLLLRWLRYYLFGSIHFLGIPFIHGTDTEPYEWESLNPLTGASLTRKSLRGEIPLREFIPVIDFKNLDVYGGQINVKVGTLIRIINPLKVATIPRDWFPFFVDMMRGHIREFFAPLDFFRVMISKKNFGKYEEDKPEKNEDNAGDLAEELMEDYFKKGKIKDEKANPDETKTVKEDTLLESIKNKYGIEIIKFYIMDPDPTAGKSTTLLEAVSDPGQAKIDAKSLLTRADAEAKAFGKRLKAMQEPGGRFMRTLEAIEKSRLVTLGESGKDLRLMLNIKDEPPEPKKEPKT